MNIGEVVKAAIATMRSIGWFGLIAVIRCVVHQGPLCQLDCIDMSIFDD